MQATLGNPTTTSLSTTQEVLLRTMASDIASLQHGSQIPTPQQYTAQFATAEDQKESPSDSGRTVRLILALLFLAGIGVAMYYFVYPSFVEVQ